MGALDGFTYKEVQGAEATSNCFYSGFAITQNVDNIIFIFQNAKASGKYLWYDYIIQEPTEMLINATALVQTCNFSEYVSYFENFTNIDFSGMTYEAVSLVIYGVLDIPKLIKQANAIKCAKTCTCPDSNGVRPETPPENCDGYFNGWEYGNVIGKGMVDIFGAFVNPIAA